jgi:asparagine synthase (glutamine-hydrolysing)
MCGISGAILTKESYTQDNILKFYNANSKIQHRGPDKSIKIEMGNNINICISFNRLSINDLTSKGDQPFKYEHYNKLVYVMCNGEIYNYKEIIEDEKFKCNSHSDCEVIIEYYKKYGKDGINKFLNLLNSEHSFAIFDIDINTGNYNIILSTDRFGIRPLFLSKDETGIYFSSELQGLPNLHNPNAEITRFKPMHYAFISKYNNVISNIMYHKYCDIVNIKEIKTNVYENKYFKDIRYQIEDNSIATSLLKAVSIRMDADRPLGCLLSGGVDSSLVSSLASLCLKEFNLKLHTFSIGMTDGTDEKYAKIVSEYIGSIHTHITCSENDFLDAIPKVIETLGTFDITTIRASVGQYLLAEWISKNTDIKVLLCGDGSDEVCGSYKYFHNCPSDIDFHEECLNLLSNIHCFDGLRADRCISHFGLEARFPFLDYNFVKTYLSHNASLRRPVNKLEKFLLRTSFYKSSVLPNDVLFRSKTAFSDGVSSYNRSWHTIITEKINELITDEYYETHKNNYDYLPPISKEALYYRETFVKHFGNNTSVSHTIPYFWLPKWCGIITDPSARVLVELCDD